MAIGGGCLLLLVILAILGAIAAHGSNSTCGVVTVSPLLRRFIVGS
jgi:hypothetical protein